MRKEDELSKEHTCMQHAHPKEMVFVLLSRDAAAPVAIRAWVAERLRLGKNVETERRSSRRWHARLRWRPRVVCGPAPFQD